MAPEQTGRQCNRRNLYCLGLLRQLVPNATTIAMLVNPNYPATSAEVRDVQAAARTIGLQTDLLTARGAFWNARNTVTSRAAFAASFIGLATDVPPPPPRQ